MAPQLMYHAGMSPVLKQSKHDIRIFIRAWPTQKLAEVYAFNQDGHMRYLGPCLLHVTLCDSLQAASWPACKLAYALKGGWEAEQGYRLLGDPWLGSELAEPIRQRRLSAILRAEMRRRDRARAMQAVESAVEAEPVLQLA